MKFSFFIVFFLLLFFYLQSTIIEVDINGSTPFELIQDAIDTSVNGDTVLVHPGTYYENIDFSEKTITVGSLNLTTGNSVYIVNTIIDGNQEGSVVKVVSGESEGTTIYGFTLQNGSGTEISDNGSYWGGAIHVSESSLDILNCQIIDNQARDFGGGISCLNAIINLSGTLITRNHAIKGGGLFLHGNCEINFDPINRCNIYLNYAGYGNEILKSWACPPIDVIVDTFTVNNPDSYFIRSTTSTGTPLYDVTLFNQNSKLDPVNNDLFVSTDGDNNNSGITPDESLASLNYALSLIQADSLFPKTIYVADGVYSQSYSNQNFPLCMRSSVSIIGESMENTVFDAELTYPHIVDHFSDFNSEYSIKNISLINSGGSNSYCMIISSNNLYDIRVFLENITITGYISDGYQSIFLNLVEIEMKNVYIYNNLAPGIQYYDSPESGDTMRMENVKIHNNHENPEDYNGSLPLLLGGYGTGPYSVIMSNVEITDNSLTESEWPTSVSAMRIMDNIDLYLINSTIGNNYSPGNGSAVYLMGSNSNINIINSILYGDLPSEIFIDNEYFSDPSSVTIQNSLVDGGYEGIQNPYPFNEINWLEGNLNEYPLWQQEGNILYMLTENSPCIDSGTLDLPNGIEIPEFDLAGNPRIYGDTIDMGAYEWQGVDSEDDQIIYQNTCIWNYPNPFNPETIICFIIESSSDVELDVFNAKGQKVRTLIDEHHESGTYSVIWEGLNDDGKFVGSGVYFYQLKSGDNTFEGKCVLLK
ncbi:MAG: hypothetical protein APR54_04260 [Candidatus Cloacimonas sp. SDB]|nr:MAG: hypothetical protein APR54_04260 [Candidatus Cloacimonas sp. SDB]